MPGKVQIHHIFWWYNNSLGTIRGCMRCVNKKSGVCFLLSWRQIFSWSENNLLKFQHSFPRSLWKGVLLLVFVWTPPSAILQWQPTASYSEGSIRTSCIVVFWDLAEYFCTRFPCIPLFLLSLCFDRRFSLNIEDDVNTLIRCTFSQDHRRQNICYFSKCLMVSFEPLDHGHAINDARWWVWVGFNRWYIFVGFLCKCTIVILS